MLMFKLFTVFVLLLATPVFVLADDNPSGGSDIVLTNPLPYDDIPAVLNRIIDFLALLAAPIAVLMLVWAAYLFVLAGTSPDNVKKAKSIILYVVIGIVVLVMSKAIVNVTVSVLNEPSPPANSGP